MNIDDIKKDFDLGYTQFSREQTAEMFAVVDRFSELTNRYSEENIKIGEELILARRANNVLEADVVRLKGECCRAWNEVNRCNRQIASLTCSLNDAMDAKNVLAREVDELRKGSVPFETVAAEGFIPGQDKGYCPPSPTTIEGYAHVEAVTDPLPVLQPPPAPRCRNCGAPLEQCGSCGRMCCGNPDVDCPLCPCVLDD